MASGHPMGLFKSKPDAPRVILTNGLLVGIFDNQEEWHRLMQLGVTNYGQMTAGGWMYIGPQGIVHGTFNTIINAGRLHLGLGNNDDLAGHLFVSSGLGGMSGAQPKAVEIARGVGIVAEVDASRIQTRYDQAGYRGSQMTQRKFFRWPRIHGKKETLYCLPRKYRRFAGICRTKQYPY